jgi:hypothetical protein
MLQNGFFNLSKVTSKFLYFLVTFLLISFSFVLHTQNVQAQTYTIWPDTARPVTSSASDRAAVELGVKFRSDSNGYITGIRFYKGSYNTGTHIGKLWTRTGTLLAQATFTNESASGWQQVSFAEPVQITANTVYVASYYAPNGRYAYNTGYFATSGVDNAPLHALQNGVSGGNGVYLYGSGGFPINTWQSNNYWVDVVFTTTGSGSDVTPPTVPGTLKAEPAGTTQVNLTWTASTDNVAVNGYEVERCQGSGCANFAKVSSVTQTSFSNSGLTSGTTYQYRVRAYDAAGNLSGYSNVASATTQVSVTPLTISTQSLPGGTQNVAYSTSLAVSGGTSPYTWSIASGSLPNGLSLSASGVISGKPTASGTSNFTVQVTDSSNTKQTATKSLTITVVAQTTKVTLVWDPPTGTSNVVGYKLYYGTSPNNYTYSKIVGNVTQAPIDDLQSGVTYYIAGVSCDTSNCGTGHESPYSNVVQFPSQQTATNMDTIETGPNASDTDRNGLTNLTDTDSDNDGFVDGLEVLTGSNPEDSLSNPQLADVMETGEVSVDHNWIKVTLTKTFVNPVVVAKITTYNEDDPAVIRIRNVDSTGFEIRIQDWQYPDDIHITESVSYTVIERGTYILDDGTMVEAGMVDTDSASTFKKISFNKTFTSIPVVITTVSTFNNEEPVTAKVKEIKTDKFSLSLKKQKNNAQVHKVETVSYIAWEVSSGMLNNMIFEVKKTPNKLGTNFRNIQFTETVTNTPVVLGDMQTTHGDNTINLRCQNLDIYGVEMKVHEEQSSDAEISEVGGYILVSPVDAP